MNDSTKQMIKVAMEADPNISSEIKEAILAITQTGRLSGMRIDPPLYLNLTQMARYLGISRTTFYSVRDAADTSGSSAFTPIDMTPGNWMYSKAHIVAYLDAKRCAKKNDSVLANNEVKFVAAVA